MDNTKRQVTTTCLAGIDLVFKAKVSAGRIRARINTYIVT